ncbi:TetR/AcrR family transcriptional regulator [Chitinophaga agrisoli]|uniref:TetR/AcrR family transcriptional regulator n=1 Tax=Chitinophaga agrisoli TaxID=2607653 RepID=A0A5B2VGR5_9BACT|nr:TetR/AcrR family transcriptional regulator [Chitinophaga agrisoli]KAA2238763.1 TetR/AcrR family transcriptional regulator [Chitinophaga agrisoli]
MARSKAFDPGERLEKARDLFWEKGYHATSMQDLVEAMRLNRGSIYDTYGDKHALFMQCLTNYGADTLEDYKAAAVDAPSPIKAVECIIRRAMDRAIEEGKACMVVKSSFELAEGDKEVHSVLKKDGARLIKVCEELLAKAQAAGEIPAERDTVMLANFIVASFTGLWQTNIISNNKKLVRQMADFLIEVVRH